MTIRLLIAYVVALGVPLSSHALLTVSVTSAPATPAGYFSARIAGGSAADSTVNPCWGRPVGTCRLGFVTIDESWHPFGIPVDYKTTDRGGWRLANGAEDGDFRTLGEWWGAVLDKGREGRDYLPLNHISEGPCVTVAGVGSTGLVLPNSVVGNCARGLVQAKSCALLPADISVELSTTTGHDISRTPVPGVQLRCDDAADVRIETNTGERIPMNGDSASVTVLDWGAGFGKPLVLHVPTNGLRQIALHVKTEGVGALPPGVISGSSIVNVTYE